MNQRTRLTRNIREGESITLDGGRVVITMVKRYGRLTRVVFDMAADVRIDRPAQEQPAQPLEPAKA